MSLPRLLRGVGAGRMTYAAHVGEHGEIPDAAQQARQAHTCPPRADPELSADAGVPARGGHV
jgi:hypothetical protein